MRSEAGAGRGWRDGFGLPSSAAAAALAANAAGPALLCLAGVRQVNRMRGRYLAAVLRQDVGYFDTTATSGAPLCRSAVLACMCGQAGEASRSSVLAAHAACALRPWCPLQAACCRA